MGSRVASPSRRWGAVAVVGLALALHAWVGHQFAQTMAAWHDQGPAMAPVEVVVQGALKPVEPVRKRRVAPPPVQVAPEGPSEGSSLASAAPPSATPEPASSAVPSEPVSQPVSQPLAQATVASAESPPKPA
ncbi:MAG: hypothetical protein ACKPCJ_01645, partial [Betaproteobacteria bacterium]